MPKTTEDKLEPTGCDKCRLDGNFISWKGPLDAKVVVLGQSPGKEELNAGIPFVGRAGKLLNRALFEAGLNVNDILFYNTVQCFPDRVGVDLSVIKACSHNVEKIIGLHKRDVIIALGNEAWATLHDKTKIGGATTHCGRVEWCEKFSCDSIWAVHPAFVLRSPGWYNKFVDALRRAVRRASPDSTPHPKTLITNCTDYHRFDDKLISTNGYDIAFDIETGNVKGEPPDFIKHDILGIGLAWGETAIYIPFTEVDDWPDFYRWLKTVLEGNGNCIAHNANFDAKFLIYQYDIHPNVTFDTIVAHRILDENSPHRLKSIATEWLGVDDWDLFEEMEQGDSLASVPIDVVGEYCAKDAFYTLRLKEMMEEKLKTENLVPIFEKDTNLFNVLRYIELRGMKVDINALREEEKKLDHKIAAANETANKASGWGGKVLPHNRTGSGAPDLFGGELDGGRVGVNPSSSADVSFIIYKHFKLSPPVGEEHLTKTGVPTTNKKTLQVIRNTLDEDHPAIEFLDAMEEYRSLRTMKGYVIDGLRESIRLDGLVHTEYGFNTRTEDNRSPVSGRLSSNSPNLQNIPKQFRRLFIPPDGYVFIEADYSALEVRVWAQASGDPDLVKALERDYHTVTAASIFGISEDEVTKQQRDTSKIVTFGGVMNGGGASVITRQLGVSREEAEVFLNNVYRRFPLGKMYLDGLIESCRRTGYVESLFGRRRRLLEIQASDTSVRLEAERQAVNAPIQAAAADLTNMALVRLFYRLPDDCWIVNTVHDSILVAAPEPKALEIKELVEKTLVEKPTDWWNVELEVEIEITERWGESNG